LNSEDAASFYFAPLSRSGYLLQFGGKVMKIISTLRMFGPRTLMLIYILLIGCAFLVYNLIMGHDIASLPLHITPLLIGLGIAIYTMQSNFIQTLDIETRKIENENRNLEMKLNAMDTLDSHDAVTGLPTFLFQKDRISAAIQRAKRKSRHMAVYRIQVGTFTPISPKLEEMANTQVITQKAERIKSLLRGSDSIMHISHRNFLIVAESIKDMEDILLINQKLESTLKAPIVLPDGTTATVIDTYAVALYPFDGEDSDSLLAVAEDNLKSGCYLSAASKSGIYSAKPVDLGRAAA
jgi:GGDEF domain-containing protein